MKMFKSQKFTLKLEARLINEDNEEYNTDSESESENIMEAVLPAGQIICSRRLVRAKVRLGGLKLVCTVGFDRHK